MVYDILIQTKNPLAVCSNDAQSYLGRIMYVATFITLQWLGTPKPIISSMIYTIQMMEHIIYISFCDSISTYGGTEWNPPPHGSIQGNGILPIIWATISTILFLELKKKNHGGTFQAPTTKLLTSIIGFAFVDDTDLLQNKQNPTNDIINIVDELQGSLDIWQGILRTTCVALDCDDPNKSYWYIVNYKWSSDRRWKYCV